MNEDGLAFSEPITQLEAELWIQSMEDQLMKLLREGQDIRLHHTLEELKLQQSKPLKN